MLFQSQFYVLVFLPAVACLYYAVAGSTRARQWFLIGASLVFYGWWDVRFVVLPVSQVVATWLLARLHERSGARAPLIAGVVLNLLSLATFKYFNFVLASIGAAIGITLPRRKYHPADRHQLLYVSVDLVPGRPHARPRRRSIRSALSPCSCCSIRT